MEVIRAIENVEVIGFLTYSVYVLCQKFYGRMFHDNNNIYLVDSKEIGAFENPDEICNQIDTIAKDEIIKVILRTDGGELFSCEKILKKLKNHRGEYIAYIKNECFSSGTIIALGAREIVMTEDSYLGKIDPQMQSKKESEYYIPAIVYHALDEKYITNKNIILVRICEQMLNYIDLLLDNYIFKDNEKLKKVIRDELIYSKYPHHRTYDFETCLKMGLNVRRPKEEECSFFV